MESNKKLIAYYSRTGNTAAVAKLIQETVGGNLWRIKTAEERPRDYAEEVALNQQEQQQGLLPSLDSSTPDFDGYEIIFLGAPTWNMALPQAVVAFLETYDFSNKIIVPFNTHGGYGSGTVFTQIRKYAKHAEILKGFSIHGGEERNGVLFAIQGDKEQKTIQAMHRWLDTIEIK